jgi:hypothetical protein
MTTNTSSIKLGVVVRDLYRKTGIVCSKEPVPAQDWIDGLVHSAEVKKLGPTDWWGVLVFGGGYLLVPRPLLTYLRDATYDDFLEAADTAHKSGRERLLSIFPHYVEQLLAERRRAESED